jgi:hypothetical protein
MKIRWLLIVLGVFVASNCGRYAAKIFLRGQQHQSSTSAPATNSMPPTANIVPPELIERTLRIGDLPVGGSTCTYFGYHVATDRTVWIDPGTYQAESCGSTCCGGNYVRVTWKADGYHVRIFSKVDLAGGEEHPWMLKVLGHVRAVEVTH